MITSREFSRLIFRAPRFEDDRPLIDKIIGIDSEAFTTGEPFIFCTSLGEAIEPDNFIETMFEPRYANANFVVYNLKYDSGAFLYHMPREYLHVLWRRNEVEYNGLTYSYIPHKALRIKLDKETKVVFWDIAQFYKMTLDRAAQRYLNERKIDIRTKNFTPAYWKRFRRAIIRYCIQDAVLTARLGEYLINKLDEFGIQASALYSCASISAKYFIEHSNIDSAYRLFKDYPKLLKIACDAYEGGKFEITHRGAFAGYEYDLTSAYPYEIRNLVSVADSHIVYSKRYQKDAIYGFMRAHVKNYSCKHIPCGLMMGNLRVYPGGQFYTAITKQEYEYLVEVGVEVDILEGAWIFVERKIYPYRNVIDTLFKIKSDVKGNDAMLYNTSKIVMNSFYGKLAQCIPDDEGNITAGQLWHPIHAAVITANTRLKITRIQNMLGDKCLAVHTDSVMVTEPIPEKLVTGKLGDFEYVTKGNGYLVGCGMYQLGNLNAYKGFKPKAGESWQSILTRFKYRSKIPYYQLHVESWREAMSRNHAVTRINVFETAPKDVDLNVDAKRVWPGRVRGIDLLSSLQKSEHKIIAQCSPPEYWAK